MPCINSDLLAVPELPDLLRLRRPAAVTEALMRAVYYIHLARFEDPPDPAGAVTAFRDDVATRFPFLQAARAGMRSSEAAKTFMLQAVSKAPPDLLVRDELLATPDLAVEDLDYLKQIAALAGPATAPQPEGNLLALAEEAARQDDFDRAFSLARSAPYSVPQARLLCECAFELATLEARAEAVSAVSSLSDDERAAFLTRRVNQQLWDILQEDVSAAPPIEELEPRSVPTDWCSWLDYLDMHDGRYGTHEIARRAADEWSVTEFLSQAGAAEQLAAKLGQSRSQAAEHVLRDCLPHLLAFFQKDPSWPNPALKAVYRHLIDLLFFSTEGGRADLVVFNELLDAALTLGAAGAAEYGELITYLSELWARFAAPATLDWAIDTLAILVAHPCPDAAARRSFFVAILDRLTAFLRHVEPEHWALLRLIAADLSETDLLDQYAPAAAAPVVAAEDPLAALSDMSVAVYTLTENAGKQFKAVLESRTPGVRITLCHDLVATSRLKQAARQADLFLVATGSATHAATACIAANRPEEKPTLYPSGKGAASLLRAVRDYLRTR